MASLEDAIVVLGSGYAGMTAARELARKAARLPGRAVVLVNKHEYHQFITELHKPAAGSSDSEYIRIPLVRVFSPRRVRLVKGTAERIDLAGHRIRFTDGGELGYSKLIVCVGSDPEFFGIPGLQEHSFTLRSLNSARTIHEHIEYQLASSKLTDDEEERRACRTFVIGGAGLTGVEMAAELSETLPALAKQYDIDPAELQVYNIEAVPEIMRGFDTELARHAARDLERRGVRLILGVPIARVQAGSLELADGRVIRTNTVVWSGGVRANDLVERSGFTVTSRGRGAVDGGMRSVDHPDVFLAGDCAGAIDPNTGRLASPTAHNAIDQGRVAARNVLADLGLGPPAVFQVVDLGAVASLGESFAVGVIGRFKLIGRPASILKELIELKWIFSLGGFGLVLRRLPRLLRLVKIALLRRASSRPLIGPPHPSKRR